MLKRSGGWGGGREEERGERFWEGDFVDGGGKRGWYELS